MQQLIEQFEDDLGIKNDFLQQLETVEFKETVSLLKKKSASSMEMALKTELSLQRGDSVDRSMPTEQVLLTAKRID